MKENGVTAEKLTNKFFTAPESSLDGFSVREILATIWRRKLIVVGTMIVMTFLAIFIIQRLTPKYTGKALIMLESREQNVVNLDAVLSGLSNDIETIGSEIQVINSRRLARSVITELSLRNDPYFNTALKQSSNLEQPSSAEEVTGFTQIYQRISGFVSGFISDNDERTMQLAGFSESEYQQQMEWSRLIDHFVDNLDVYQVNKSRVIAIEYEAKTPVMAARIVNTLADVYIDRQLEVKFEATKRATSWLSQKVSELQKTVEQSDTLVEQFRRESGLLQGKEGGLTAQQASEINSQLMLAKANLTEARVRLRQVKKHAGSRSAIESTTEILQSVLIQRLRAQESDIQRNIAELSTEYGQRHPKMINLTASLGDLQRKIDLEAKKIIRGLENEVAISRSRVWSLQNSLNGLKEQVADANGEGVRLNALEREAEANRMLLNTFLSRLKEISSQEGADVHKADASIVSRASLPVNPSFPKKVPILLLTIVFSIFIGLLLVFLVEHMEAGFQSGEQIEYITGIPSLGFIPLINTLDKLKQTESSYFVDQPRSAFSQSINSLRWNVELGRKQNKPAKTILITSTQPQEGKTTIAVSLARKYALAGKKTLIIDADCYMPSVGEQFKLDHHSGLIDVLLHEQSFKDVVKVDETTGVHILLNGKFKANPTNILASNRFHQLLKALSSEYDMIVFDSSPVLASSDALILSRKVDATIFVVRWATTKQKAVNLSLNKLLKTDSHLAGVVLSMVDVDKYSLYDYGDSGAYVGSLKNYYKA